MSFADQLTLARAAAVPIVIVLFVWDFPNHNYWATAVFAVAMATGLVRRAPSATWGASRPGRRQSPRGSEAWLRPALSTIR
jgi:hypothetical protein